MEEASQYEIDSSLCLIAMLQNKRRAEPPGPRCMFQDMVTKINSQMNFEGCEVITSWRGCSEADIDEVAAQDRKKSNCSHRLVAPGQNRRNPRTRGDFFFSSTPPQSPPHLQVFRVPYPTLIHTRYQSLCQASSRYRHKWFPTSASGATIQASGPQARRQDR